MEASRYVLSPFIVSSKGERGVELYHNVTDRSFSISEELSDVISTLDSGRSKFDIIKALTKISNETDAESCFFFLLENDVISDLKFEVREYYLRKAALTVFGLDRFRKSDRNKIVFVGVPSSVGSNFYSGCIKFPSSIRQMTNGYNLQYESDDLTLDFIHGSLDSNRFRALMKFSKVRDGGDLFIDTFENQEVILERIRKMANDLFSGNNIPFFLGGDHLITLPVLLSLKKHYEKIQIIQFDAHTDTYHTAEDKRSVVHHGNFIKRLINESHIHKVIQIGIRGLPNIRQTKPNVKQQIISGSMLTQYMENEGQSFDIDADMPTYISFDIDFINSGLAPGTNMPVCGGLSYENTFQLLQTVLTPLKNIIGIDLVEVNPELDERNKTMEIATEIILSLLSFLKI